jgi:hypothetical protein
MIELLYIFAFAGEAFAGEAFAGEALSGCQTI